MIDKKSMFDSVLEVVAHEFRYELQYIFIPKLVAAINNGELDSSHLHKVEDWSIWVFVDSNNDVRCLHTC